MTPALPPLEHYAALAAERMTDLASRYAASAAGSGHTARWNEERYQEIRLAPRVGVDVTSVDPSVRLLGRRLPHPVLLAPTGCHRLFHPEGELASVRGAGEAGALFVVSSYTTTPTADIAAAARGPWWFQLNPAPDAGFVANVLDEAVARGAEALVVTLDTPVAGMRSGQGWDGVSLPDGLEFGVLRDLPAGLAPPADPEVIHRSALDAGLTWDRLAGLCAERELPVLVKGVLRGDDAERAVAAGAAGIIVSNHGGRNLDTLPATVDALPRVVERVAGRVPVLVDGGVRSGGDVLKALALGANAVLLGRPYLWGLAAEGAEGVRRVVTRLRVELEMAMALCGVRTTDEITDDVLWT
ncbi:alpha-hydroxy acid oxidase [Streptomyces sp. B6B3]|uniref:alpha-hydroxy acid oxidase n=1 Tax=Streptomyces sp. B6B3 TaxID=3153570 RepID=UPI00325DC3AF